MSFSSETKSELAKIFVQRECCARAELCAMMMLSQECTRERMTFCTDNSDVSDCFSGLILRCFDIGATPTERRRGRAVFYTTSLSGEIWQKIFDGLFPGGEKDIRKAAGGCGKCPEAFISGAFLACGFAGDPEKQSNIGFTLEEPDTAVDFALLIEEKFGCLPKMSVRKGKQTVFFRFGENVIDLLTYMGAQRAAFAEMNGQAIRSIRNKENRQTNFEVANISKTANASSVQTEAVVGLKKLGKFGLLPSALQRTANLREENPTATLSELCTLEDTPVSRSQESKRLRKIVDFYNFHKK